MSTRREQIQKAIANTRAFREWLTENIPKRNVNLNVWLTSGTGRDLSTAPLSEVISCGTIGCLGGWSDVYFREVKSHRSAHTFFGGSLLHGKYFDPLFSAATSRRSSEDRDDRRTCLRRLDRRVQDLSKALRQA